MVSTGSTTGGKKLLRPYGDTTGDGMVQLSFTLPMPHDKTAEGAAQQLANKMGMDPALVVHAKPMGPDFTFFVVYGRVDLERVAKPELPVLEPGLLGEVLVEELGHRDRVRGLHRVGGGEVVVLTGVDDDPRPRVDLAAEPLVNEGADRVDVAEEDPVHRVVEHHVEPLEPREGGDLRHAQAEA